MIESIFLIRCGMFMASAQSCDQFNRCLQMSQCKWVADFIHTIRSWLLSFQRMYSSSKPFGTKSVFFFKYTRPLYLVGSHLAHGHGFKLYPCTSFCMWLKWFDAKRLDKVLPLFYLSFFLYWHQSVSSKRILATIKTFIVNLAINLRL